MQIVQSGCSIGVNCYCGLTMTTYRQEEYESFLLEGKETVTDVKVTNETTNHPKMMTDKEMEDATAVFRSLETGLRGGTIYPEDLHKAMKMLGAVLTTNT